MWLRRSEEWELRGVFGREASGFALRAPGIGPRRCSSPTTRAPSAARPGVWSSDLEDSVHGHGDPARAGQNVGQNALQIASERQPSLLTLEMTIALAFIRKVY